jgi:hypothetical protein
MRLKANKYGLSSINNREITDQISSFMQLVWERGYSFDEEATKAI